MNTKTRRIALFTSITVLTLLAAGWMVSAHTDKQPALVSREAAQDATQNKIAHWVLDHTVDGKEVEFIVVLADQADLKGAASFGSKGRKGRFVRDSLLAKAVATQAPILDLLKFINKKHRSFYIVNAILVTGGRDLVDLLAARPDVARIEGNPRIKNDLTAQPTADELNAAIRSLPTLNAPEAIELGVTSIRAPEVWATGFTGQGIVIAGADTGIKWDHAALKNKYRGWDGVTADHNYNWHDSIHSGGGSCGPNSTAPCDDNNHGTHTVGTVLGDDGGENQIGAAPGAKFIGCRNMDQGNGTPATYIECMEWFLAPYPIGGTPAQGDPAKAPHITTNSWTCPASEGCSPSTLQAAVEAQRAAGILMVVAAGNAGSACSTVGDPPSFYAASYTVGAISASAGTIAGFSSRGPVTADGSNRLKPEITAPGVSVRSAVRSGGYSSFSGTSMATPHVAGAVALLWSARPALRGQIQQTIDLLNTAAVDVPFTDCSSSGVPNNVYGWGRLDIKAAVDAAVVCGYLLDPANASHTAAANSGSVNVTTAGICNWSAVSNDTWIQVISGNSGTGNGTVNYSVAANTGPQRTGALTISGQTFTVAQDNGCSFAIAPLGQNFIWSGGNGSVDVMTANGCAWAAISNHVWITITSGASGSGPGAVNYSVAANTGNVRAGTLTVAGQTFTITQGVNPGVLQYYPLAQPVRLLDTRPGFGGCFTPGAPLGNDAVITQPAVGACTGIPANAKAIVGNATVVNLISSGSHWITLFPSDAALPNASNLNFSDNQIVPNSFTVGLGADGAFKIYSHAATHFIVDVTGYYAPPGAGGLYFHPLPAPRRLLDTRAGFSACDAPGVPLGNDAIRAEQATVGCTGIPATAKAIAGNATVVNFISTGFHWITLYPFGATLPNASNLNFTANQIVPNSFVAGLSNDGKFNIYSHAATDFIVDVAGYFSDQATDVNGAGLLYNALPAPIRLLDTRAGFIACDAPGLPLGNNAVRTEQATIACTGVPAAAQAIVGNATVVNFISSGFHWITLYPFGAALPNASNLNFSDNQIVPNAFVVGLSNDGRFNIYSHASTHFIVDLTGYFAP